MKTLGNKIRRMTDEELAEFISNISREDIESRYCKTMCPYRVKEENGVMGCRVVLEKCPYSYKDIWLDFLQSDDDRMDYNGCMLSVGIGSSS